MHLVALPNSNCITFSQSALFFGRPSDTEASQTEESFDPCEHVDFATKAQPVRPRKKSTLVALDQHEINLYFFGCTGRQASSSAKPRCLSSNI